MKIYLHLATCIIPLMLFGHSGDGSYSNQKTCCILDNSYLTVGANYTYANLEVGGEPSFNGSLGGLQALYEYQPKNNFYGGVELAWRDGNTQGSYGNRHFIDVNTNERLGYTWCCDQWLCTVYTGFGFRFMSHHLTPSTSAPTSFLDSYFPPFLSDSTSLRFNYYEFYFPIGIKTEYAFSPNFNLGLQLVWSLQAFSTVRIDTLGGAFWELQNTFGNIHVELPLTYTLECDKRFSFTLSPFYERWQDGLSTAETSGGTALGLPENTYNFWGVNFNFTYLF
ncbi:MAG: hypothetical protein P4L16_00265 [Chlamydiales bacterium]|nr:hypothetical protein [Chlamydiales bacterium]